MLTNTEKKNKKVCHVTSAHNRYDVRIFHKECKSLANHGFDVTLLVNDNADNEIIDGVKIISTHFKPNNRYERMVVSQKRVEKAAVDIDADIYHFHDPELLPLASAMKKRGKKVVFDFHEDVAQQILYKYWIPKGIRGTISAVYRVYEASKAKRFDALISVTPKFVERLTTINPMTFLVTNYPILKGYDLQNNASGKSSICFAGGVSPQWKHENIINAIEEIDGINYLLAGNGNEDYISSLKQLRGWKKVKYLGKIPHEEVRDVYSSSIAGMTLLSRSTQVGDEGTLGNTKIFEFMEAGLPVICSNHKLWVEIIESYKCGIAVSPDDINEIARAINYIMDNPDEALKMGQNGKKAILERFNWKTQEDVLVSVYSSL